MASQITLLWHFTCTFWIPKVSVSTSVALIISVTILTSAKPGGLVTGIIFCAIFITFAIYRNKCLQ